MGSVVSRRKKVRAVVTLQAKNEAEAQTSDEERDKEEDRKEEESTEDKEIEEEQEEDEEDEEQEEQEEKEESEEDEEQEEQEEIEDDDVDDDDDDGDGDGDEDDEEEEEKEAEEKDNEHHKSSETYSEKAQKALLGDLNTEFPENVKVVRIFTSSTFTDTSVERNTLMERVYPRLKSYCQERGFDFQVVDMRWGVRDEATDDHMTSELCMRELRACQKLSTGPNFITFLGQKYGYRPFPPMISASEFRKLLSAVKSEDDQTLLTRWFRRDDNSVPAHFLLQPITSILPHYRDYDNSELRKKASGNWWAAFEKMQVVLREAADQVLPKNDRQKFYMSVTEDEIRRGIINTRETTKHCFWFNRVITNLEENIDTQNAGKFMDKAWNSRPPAADGPAQKLLKQLREEHLPEALPSSNIVQYDVEWSENGVDPKSSSKHALYIENLCKDFFSSLTNLIDEGIREKEEALTRDPLSEELFQHASFCQKKCKSFHGRKEFLEDVKVALKDSEKRSIVLHGESGCGKTSIMAKIASVAKDWLEDESAITVIRFIGISPDSSTIRLLLRSVCLQLCKATGQDSSEIPEDMKSLVEFFPECLEKACEDHPVILVLDSLDQLSVDDGGRQLDWFPRNLPGDVYAVLSTLPGQQYQCLPSLRTILPQECLKEVPPIPLDEADLILESWLQGANRSLTPEQKQVVLDAFQKCPLPLYLKLAFDEACRWKSYTPSSETLLAPTIRESIDAFFDRIERVHGKILVSHALAYITASKNGLTETELEDLLSLDDEVLNDVYQYWTPPVRRLPPLLWIRIRAEIGDYLTDRGADDVRVMAWYHRQFVEVAREQYLPAEQATKIHKNMSEYFLGKWSDGVKKPYVNKEGKEVFMDRLLTKQPLLFDTADDKPIFNLRKLSELPYHLLHSGQLDKVKEEALCNLEFVLAKLRGTSLEIIMEDYSTYLEKRPTDGDVQLLHETLRLGTSSLSLDARQLPTQLIGRMFNFLEREEKYPFIHKMLKQAFDAPCACFLPNRKFLTAPGGVLRSAIKLPGYGGNDQINIAPDNRTVSITCQTSDGLVIMVIDYHSGKQLRRFVLQEPSEVQYTNFTKLSEKSNDILLLGGSHKIFLMNIETGLIFQEFLVTDDDWFSYNPVAPIAYADDENLLVAIGPEGLLIWQVQSGKLVHKLPIKGINKDEQIGAIDARGDLAFYSLHGKTTVHFLNVKIGKEINEVRISYPKPKDGGATYIREIKTTSRDELVVMPSSLDGLRVYDFSGNLIREISTFKMTEGVGRLQITDDGTKALSSDVFEICITDLETGNVENCLRSPIYRMRIVTRDGVNILSAGHDNILRTYDKNREEEDENQNDTNINEIQGNKVADQITAITPGFDQRHVVTVAMVQLQNKMAIWDAWTGKKVREVGNMMFFPNPVRMCSATRGVGFIYDQNLPHYRVFNFKAGVVERILDGKACKRMNAFGFIDHNHIISFSKGRRFLKVWDVDTGKVVNVIKFKEKQRFEEMLVSADGKVVICSQASQMTEHQKNKGLPLLAVDTRNFTHNFLKYGDENLILFNAHISHDGKYLVTIVEYSKPLLWDVTSGKLKHKLFDEDSYVGSNDAAVSSVTNVAVTAQSDGGIRVWDIESGTVLRTLDCPAVTNIYFSANGEILFTRDQQASSFDAWDVIKGKKLSSITTDGVPNFVNTIGNRLVLGIGENPNLCVLRLHRPGRDSEEEKGGTEESPYEGVDLITVLKDGEAKPTVKDGMDDDKDDDKGHIM